MLELTFGLDCLFSMIALGSQRIPGIQDHTNHIRTVNYLIKFLPNSFALASLNPLILIELPFLFLLQFFRVNILILIWLIFIQSPLGLQSELLKVIALYFGLISPHIWPKSFIKSLNISELGAFVVFRLVKDLKINLPSFKQVVIRVLLLQSYF